MAKSLENLLPTLFLCSLVSFLLSGVEGGHHRASALFVFGDSYADTGNINKSSYGPWYVPYGITFPGKPAGRFSDGRVLSDFIAKFLGLKSPIPYTQRKVDPSRANSGVNYAVGGTGVLDVTAYPNMTTQIDFFQQMVSGRDDVPIDANLTHSIAFVSLSGNDYNIFITKGGSFLALPSFIEKVVHNLASNLQRILGLGVGKILVSGLQPLGCVPAITASTSFKKCNDIYNFAVRYHNLLLRFAVANLNNQSQKHYHTTKPQIHILDLYDAFFTAFQAKDASSGGLRFENPFRPCCLGTNANSTCGMVDKDGKKLYTLCDDRSAAFFWDMFHPTQAGWEVVFPNLNVTLNQALY